MFQIGISKPTGFYSSEVPQHLVEKLAATERENQALLIRLRQLEVEALSKPAEPVKDPRLDGLLEKISHLEDRLKHSKKKRPNGKPDESEDNDSDRDSGSDADTEGQGITTPSGQTVPLMHKVVNTICIYVWDVFFLTKAVATV